jgi:hypothetical protein
MRAWGKVLAAAVVLAAGAAVQAQEAAGPARLQVKRVVLYKNGVGYFEHAGTVRGNQEVSIDFTSGQLDDVVKSLTVIDSGAGQIAGASYNSTAPLSRQLSTLRLPLGEQTSLVDFLRVLRGTRIEARTGTGAVTGRLLSVEQKQRLRGEQTVTVDEASLITDGGEVRTFELTPATTVRIAESELREDVGRYLEMLAATRAKDIRRMTIATAGRGERELLVSYISEVPVWKSTYRIVMPSKAGEKPLLQGWAIVDNTVGQDWQNVELSLVAGTPQSFIQQLSQPYYSRRPVMPLPQAVMLSPQTHEATLDGQEKATGIVGGVPGGRAEGIGSARPQRTPSAAAVAEMSRDRAEMNELMAAQEAAAESRELGELFEYRLRQPVTIRKDQSALVPILQTQIEAERVSLWNGTGGRPRRALWVTNSSGLTLDGGAFNVLDAGAFAGEGLLEQVRPGERRLISYAADTALVIEDKRESSSQRISRLLLSRGVLTQISEQRETRVYTARNSDATARTLVIEHPARPEWKLKEGTKTEETTVSAHRFRLAVEPRSTAKLAVEEFRPLSVQYRVTALSDDQLQFYLRQAQRSPELEQLLRRVLERKGRLAAMDAQMAARQQQIGSIFEDQQRVRENLKSLKGSAEERALIQRYTRQLNEQEDRLEALRREVAELQRARATAQAELEREVEQMSLEVVLG